MIYSFDQFEQLNKPDPEKEALSSKIKTLETLANQDSDICKMLKNKELKADKITLAPEDAPENIIEVLGTMIVAGQPKKPSASDYVCEPDQKRAAEKFNKSRQEAAALTRNKDALKADDSLCDSKSFSFSFFRK